MNIVKYHKLLLVLCLSILCLMNGHAQISSTRQNLDDFSLKKGVTANGGISFSNELFKGSDSLVTRDPYSFYLNGNLNINVCGIAMPFSFSLSNTQRSFMQPFNRFKLDPSYKWVHLLLGTSSLSYSPYTLAGHTISGAGVELTPGNWYISGIYGRLKKAVEYDPLVDNINTIAYKRMGYAAKVGYNSEKGSYMVTFFHGEDDENSLKQMIPVEGYITPKRNTAVSLSVNQTFLKYFFIAGEYALSAYNSNIMNDDGIEVESSSLIDMWGKENADKSVDAYNLSLGYQGKIWGLSVKYEHVDPYYSTLGGYCFDDDRENYTIVPNVKLLEGKLNFSGNFGLQYDNLDNMKQSDNKRLIYSANLSYASGNIWSGGVNFSNFKTHTRMKPESYPFMRDALDSLNFYQVSNSLSAFSSFLFGDKESPNNITVSASMQKAKSLTEDVQTSYNDFYNANTSYSKTYNAIKLSWSALFNFNYSDVTNMNTYYYGPGARITKSFVQDKISTSFSTICNMNQVEGREMGGMLNSQLGATYTIKAKNEKLGSHSFSLDGNFTRYLGSTATSTNVYELLARITYSANF